MSHKVPRRVVVTDANILINLIHVDGLEILSQLPRYTFVAPDEVIAEITVQHEQLRQGIARGYLQQSNLSDVESLAVYGDLQKIMGKGEAACLALASQHSWYVASDEKGAFRREAIARLGPGRLLTTPGLFILAIRAHIWSIDDADRAKAVLEQRRFRMKFQSFRDIVENRNPGDSE